MEDTSGMNRASLFRSLWLGVGGPVVLAAILLPVLGRARDNHRRTACSYQLKQLMLGMAQYRFDCDGAYPPVAINAKSGSFAGGKGYEAFGWADSLQPYIKSRAVLYCPSDLNMPSEGWFPEQPGYTDFWMNANLAGSTKPPSSAIAMGDGNGQGTARYALRGLPSNWRDAPPEEANASGPDHVQEPWFKRHRGGANYAFADGHVKWMLPELVNETSKHFSP